MKRLDALEAKSAQDGILLRESQLAALEKKKNKLERFWGEITTEYPGYLMTQDTYYVGTIKGVGKIYQQTVIDTYSRLAEAKLYTDKTLLNSADILNDRIISFFAKYNLNILRILTNRGTEYCGSLKHDVFQIYLSILKQKLIHLRLMVFVRAFTRL